MQILFSDDRVGRRVRQLRLEKGMTPEALAEAAGCPLLDLIRFEAGTRNHLDSRHLTAIAHTLHTPLETLTKQ